MAFAAADRVKETSTTTGTGSYTLAGAATGFQSFAAIGSGNTCHYVAEDGTNWEVGIGTYSSSTLARTTILASSNSDAAVNWSAGTRNVFCVLPADKAVILDESQTLTNKTLTQPVISTSFNMTAASSEPSTPSTGDVYLDAGSNRDDAYYGFRYYDGSEWIDLPGTSMGGP